MKTRSVFALGMVAGVAIGTLLAGFLTGPTASAQLPPLSQQRPQGSQILLDERKLELVYANGYRLHTSPEEVIADLGFNMPNPSPQGAQAADLLFDVRMRLVMSFATAKRFQDSLGTLIKLYEDKYGAIQTTLPTPKTPAAGTGTGIGTASPSGTSPNPIRP